MNETNYRLNRRHVVFHIKNSIRNIFENLSTRKYRLERKVFNRHCYELANKDAFYFR